MKACGGMDVHIHVFLTLVLVGGYWSPSRPEEKALGAHWIADWMAPGTGLDDVERVKSCLYWYSNSDPSAVQPVASCYIDWAIPAPFSDWYLGKAARAASWALISSTAVWDCVVCLHSPHTIQWRGP
jgi:hypothetical protein